VDPLNANKRLLLHEERQAGPLVAACRPVCISVYSALA